MALLVFIIGVVVVFLLGVAGWVSGEIKRTFDDEEVKREIERQRKWRQKTGKDGSDE